MRQERFEGVYVANVTPFDENENVDWQSLDGHYEFLLQNKVHGLVPCGTTGEGPTLSYEDRDRIVSLAVEKAKAHSAKVIVGCGSNNTRTALKMIETAAKLKADAALVVTPYYNKPTQSGLIAHYKFLAEQSPLPIILYNVPGRTNVNINPETAVEIFKHPNIVGIKEASGNHGQWMALASQINFREKSLLAGDDDAFVTVCQLGGCGIISATANVVPGHFVKIYELIKAGKTLEALSKQGKLLSLIQSMFMETNPSPAKFALSAMKCMQNQVRLPLVPVSSKTEEAVLTALRGLEIL